MQRPIADPLLPPSTGAPRAHPSGPLPKRNVLAILGSYRLFIALLLLVMFNIELGGRLVGDQRPTLFLATLLAYVLGHIALLSLSFYRLRCSATALLLCAAILDILTINVLLQAEGSQSRALSLLFIIAILGTATALPARLSLLVAALCALSVLGHAGHRVYLQQGNLHELVHGGLLGLVFFVAAIAVHQLGRRAAQQELLAQERASNIRGLQALNAKIVQRMRTGIIVINQEGVIHLINDSARKLLGLTSDADELLGQRIHPQLVCAWRAWRVNPQQLPRAFQAGDEGTEVQASFSPLAEGESCQTLVFLEDTRLVSQHAQSLKLESLGRLTASIAHEIRNPLGAISHAAQLLEESEALSDGDRRFSQIITTQSRRVNQVIENVLALSRRSQIKPRLLDLSQHLEGFIAEYSEHRHRPPEIALRVESAQASIYFDPSQLDQVLTNLFDNGLRYSLTHSGRETLELRLHQHPGNELLQLDVIDNGVGIDAHTAAKIFEPFYTSESGGTGLGLYLAREICITHQTQLFYLRTAGHKSCFRLVFAHPRKRWLA